MPAVSAEIHPGDRIPDFDTLDDSGEVFSLYERFCGRPAVLAVVGDRDAAPAALVNLERLRADRPDWVIAAVVRTTQSQLRDWRAEHALRIALAADDGRIVSACLGSGDRAKPELHFLLDPNGTVAATAASTDGIISAASEAVVPDGEPAVVQATAPVLVLPRVLEPELCRELIASFASANEESGMLRVVDGKPVLQPDPTVKIRRDHSVTDDVLTGRVAERLSRRVLPEIHKAFYFPVTRFEQLKVVCYDAESDAGGGYFRLHRDNTTPDAAHRRFALTLNLNTGEYEGGHLRFPEFGPELYETPAGGAIVFSCAHLHEATAVTAGRRFALLTFFYGEDSARGPAR